MEKEELITEIKRIINAHGSFTIADVEAESTPIISSMGKDIHRMAEGFNDTHVDTYIYVNDTEESYDIMRYNELDTDTLEDIYSLAQDWEADQLQTEKRISN